MDGPATGIDSRWNEYDSDDTVTPRTACHSQVTTAHDDLNAFTSAMRHLRGSMTVNAYRF